MEELKKLIAEGADRRAISEKAKRLLSEAVTLPFANPDGRLESAVTKEACDILRAEAEAGLNERLCAMLFEAGDIPSFKEELKRLRGKVLSGQAFKAYWKAHCRTVDGKPYNDLLSAFYADGAWVDGDGWYFNAPPAA